LMQGRGNLRSMLDCFVICGFLAMTVK